MVLTAVKSMNIVCKSLTVMILTQLEKFRQALYDCLGLAKDAVFELIDAVLTSPSIPSFVSLCQSPVFRRQWSSVYAALHSGSSTQKETDETDGEGGSDG